MRVAVVPVDEADPACRDARRLVTWVIARRLTACRGVFGCLFAYLGIAETQFTVASGRFTDIASTRLQVRLRAQCDTVEQPATILHECVGGPMLHVPGVGLLHAGMVFAGVNLYLGQGMVITPWHDVEPEPDFWLQCKTANTTGLRDGFVRFDFQLDACVMCTGGNAFHNTYKLFSRSAGVFGPERVLSDRRGGNWALVGVFDQDGPKEYDGFCCAAPTFWWRRRSGLV